MREQTFIDDLIVRFTGAMSRLPGFLIRIRWFVLMLFVGFTGVTGYGITGLVIDQGLDQWFDEDDKTLHLYQTFRGVFGGDANMILLYQPENGDVFSEDSLKRLRDLEDKLNTMRTTPGSGLHRLIGTILVIGGCTRGGWGYTLQPATGGQDPSCQR